MIKRIKKRILARNGKIKNGWTLILGLAVGFIIGVMSLSGCSMNTDKPIHSTHLCCVPNADYPHSCDGILLCKENNNG